MSDAVIEAALAAHNESGSSSMDSMGNTVITVDPDLAGDTAAADDATVDAGATTDEVKDTTVEPDKTAEESAAPQQDEIDKLLAEEGIEAKSVRGENRIPYSRTKKIIQNAQVKWQKIADDKFKTERDGWAQERGSLDNYRRQEQLASQDPDRFISLLASVDSRYQKFLGVVGKTPETKTAADDDPEPQPLKDEQGNPYYTPEGWQKWQAWTRRQAVKEATTALESKYGKTLQDVQNERSSREAIEARRPAVTAQINRIIETYGEELVSQHQREIIAVMQKDGLNAAEAAAKILLPKIRQDQATMRAGIITELNKRPAAVKTTQPGQKKAVETSALSGDALIRAELDKALPNRNRD